MKQFSTFPQLTSHLNSWVGFDRMFDEIDRVSQQSFKTVNYPPYNIKKVDDNHYVVELAVAGFAKTDIDITTKGDQLVIKGSIKDSPNDDYIFKGIAERTFERTFTLADSVVVKNASLVNGFLKIWLESFIQIKSLPKKIEINDAETVDLKTVSDTKQLLTE